MQQKLSPFFSVEFAVFFWEFVRVRLTIQWSIPVPPSLIMAYIFTLFPYMAPFSLSTDTDLASCVMFIYVFLKLSNCCVCISSERAESTAWALFLFMLNSDFFLGRRPYLALLKA